MPDARLVFFYCWWKMESCSHVLSNRLKRWSKLTIRTEWCCWNLCDGAIDCVDSCGPVHVVNMRAKIVHTYRHFSYFKTSRRWKVIYLEYKNREISIHNIGVRTISTIRNPQSFSNQTYVNYIAAIMYKFHLFHWYSDYAISILYNLTPHVRRPIDKHMSKPHTDSR